MRNRLSILALAMLLLTLPAHAEVGGTAVSATQTVTTTTMSTYVATVCFFNAAASANEVYGRLFNNTETAAAATTSSPIVLQPGESICLTHNTRTQPGKGWGAYSLICATGETATVYVVTQ